MFSADGHHGRCRVGVGEHGGRRMKRAGGARGRQRPCDGKLVGELAGGCVTAEMGGGAKTLPTSGHFCCS